MSSKAAQSFSPTPQPMTSIPKVDHVGALVANGAGEVSERRGRELVVGVDEDDIVARGLSDAGAPGAVQVRLFSASERRRKRESLSA